MDDVPEILVISAADATTAGLPKTRSSVRGMPFPPPPTRPDCGVGDAKRPNAVIVTTIAMVASIDAAKILVFRDFFKTDVAVTEVAAGNAESFL